MKGRLSFLIVAVITAALAWPATAQLKPQSYLVICDYESIPETLPAQLRGAGGKITRTLPQIGVVVVESPVPGYADLVGRTVDGVRSVTPNIRLNWLEDAVSEPLEHEGARVLENTTGLDHQVPLQWGLDAIDAPEAWGTGARGKGVRVAVLDTGLYYNPAALPPMHPDHNPAAWPPMHPDLAPNVNKALAASFVPGESPWNPVPFVGVHGTYVAGIIAAADNPDDFGILGVAPEAEIVPVKVLSAQTGFGEFDWIIAGIVYAADIDADVINMSLTARIRHRSQVYVNDPDDPSDDVFVTARQHAEWFVAWNRATRYAWQSGATIIAASGNQGIDLDRDKDSITLPAELEHVMAVAATAPELWALYPGIDLDTPASYSNIGRSVIDFAAPGGDFDTLFKNPAEAFQIVVVPPSDPKSAWIYDGVYGPDPGSPTGFRWATGTSAAAAHVAGVAALVIGQNGGPMHPAKVESVLKRSADDLGRRGKDDFYGLGRVNAAKAVRLMNK